jgi:hypothetical protein
MVLALHPDHESLAFEHDDSDKDRAVDDDTEAPEKPQEL